MQTYYLETLEESIQRSRLAKYKKNKPMDPATSLACDAITEEECSSDEEGSNHDYLHEEDISDDFDEHKGMSKSDRLVEWNVEVLGYLLKQIMVARPDHLRYGDTSVLKEFEGKRGGEETAPTTVLEEFQEIIELPNIGADELLQRKHPDTIKLRPVVVEQLRDLLKKIAAMYNENPFHNFEHASHVTGKFVAVCHFHPSITEGA